MRDEAFSGDEEGEGAPDAVAAAAPAEAAFGGETIEMPPDYVGQADADAAVGRAAIGAEAVGEAGGPSETLEDVAREAILDPPGARGDVVEHMDDPVGHSVVDGVENLAFVGEDEDVVDHADDPIVEDVDPWA